MHAIDLWLKYIDKIQKGLGDRNFYKNLKNLKKNVVGYTWSQCRIKTSYKL